MTRTAHSRAAARDDPQSGPSRLPSSPGFFHVSLKKILAEPGRLAGVRKSRYINRQDRVVERDDVAADEPSLDEGRSVVRAARYIARSGKSQVDVVDDELGAHVLITRGLRAENGTELARRLDTAERKPDGSYRCYGGRLPRVGVHLIASFSRGIPPAAAGAILEDYARALSDRLKVPLEGQIHNDDHGQPDHAHLLLGTRVVEAGVIGRKVRALDAVSEKADGNATEVDGRLIGNTIEWIRSDWAARMQAAIGEHVDHRSFARRGLAVTPVTYVPRTELEYQHRRGSTAWRERRRRELAERVRAPERRGHAEGQAAGLPLTHTLTENAGIVADGRDATASQSAIQRRASATFEDPDAPTRHEYACDPKRTTPVRVGSDDVVPEPAQVAPALAARRLDKATVLERIGLLTQRHGPAVASPTVSVDGANPVAAFLHDLGLDLPAEIVTAALHRRRARQPKTTIGADGPERMSSSVTSPAHAKAPPREAPPMATTGSEKPLRTNAIEVEWALRLARILDHKRRLKRSRLEQLASRAGLTVAALEAHLRPIDGGERGPTSFDFMQRECPADLQRMWDGWAAEDNAARQARRGGGTDQPAQEPPPAHSDTSDAVIPDAGRPLAAAATAIGPSFPPAASRHGEASRPQVSIAPVLAREDRVRARPETATPITLPEAPPEGADALSDTAADARDRMVVDAFEADIERRAAKLGKGAVDGAQRDRGLALRLRVTGRSRTEVAAALAAKWTVTDEASKARVRTAVTHAFSDRTTRFIEQQAKWVARVNSLSSTVETRVYRTLRKQTLDALKQDLDAVWHNRALRADEARRRHAARLAVLHGMRWSTRRLKRCGLVVSILSNMVELAVVGPLLARAKAAASAEQDAIADAARSLSLALKRRRAEWCGFRPDDVHHRAPSAERLHAAAAQAEGRPGARDRGGPEPAGSRSDRVGRAAWFDDEERRLAAQAALILMVDGRWTPTSARHLARLSEWSEDDLHLHALRLCGELFGQSDPESVLADQARRLATSGVMAARRHGWGNLAAMMVRRNPQGRRRGTAEIT
ncbi:hypothetical protein P7D22_09080 [Lichenihabitans sp. Uapishka_5]|uniref:MobA/MobL family protein n=1 Tax=Lichenihabitans sp. Uapishka_5 TaxID=3037302 RepID=UPI0029E7F6C9|nr:MobA/MobL family protein [Lichenihabitans sp. Uapishka_5]MDX7951328.1 hypothetical protein [Lichenihabitans sp. Uapishka_5]